MTTGRDFLVRSYADIALINASSGLFGEHLVSALAARSAGRAASSARLRPVRACARPARRPVLSPFASHVGSAQPVLMLAKWLLRLDLVEVVERVFQRQLVHAAEPRRQGELAELGLG